ncbi:helix-turn-helix domain-containing protein [Dethiosulfovibrio sp. F2B]|uniref:helix-turn-helix transcriptional regulator n=1 Tax=Dethiosulfovibrio faecalis TaxID=2720018 RepID=UPI001F1628C3|nr:helix-turn-helix domain-containing protein [Dethiosulfovibrio faecalis]
MNKLQERISKYRSEEDLSQAGFGDLIGVDQPTVGRWEGGQSPSRQNMHKLARLFACDVGVLAKELYENASNPPHPREKEEVVSA